MTPEPSSSSTGRRESQGALDRAAAARRARRIFWIALTLVVVLGVTGYFTARPAWRMVKTARAKKFLRESDAFLVREEWTSAFQRSRSALQLAPFHPEIVRHAARLHGRFGLESGLRHYEQLLGMPTATREDRLGYVELALKLGAMEAAWSQLEELLAEAKPVPQAQMLGAQYFSFRRNPVRALSLARSAVEGDPSNATNSMILGTLLASSRLAADRAEAMKLLGPLAEAPGALQLRALGAILSMPGAERAERERAEAVLAAMKNRTQEAELLWLEARISMDATLRGRLADEAVERWGRSSAEELSALGSWLNRQGLSRRTLELVLPDAALANELLFRVRYDALVAVGDLRGAYALALADRAPGDPLMVEQVRCATAARLGDDAAVTSHLRSMIDLARGRPRQLRIVAELATRYQKRELADEANKILSRNRREAVPAFQALMRSADMQGETWVARDYARKLEPLMKGDEALRMQIAYYDLLLLENLEQAHATALALHQSKPGDFNRRVVLALSHLRRNEPALAASLIEGQTVTWGRLPPGVRAVVASILGSTRRESGAVRLLQRTPLALLKPEERELIRPYLSGLPAPELRENLDEKPEKL